MCVCGGGDLAEEEGRVGGKSAGMQPNPLGSPPPTNVAHHLPNDTSSLLYKPRIPALVTREDTDRYTLYAQRTKVSEVLFTGWKMLAVVQRRIISLPCCFLLQYREI